MCFVCQDFKIHIGHETKWCPYNICKKCGQKEHIKMECMLGMEDLPLPNKILAKIFSYLSLKDLGNCAQVSKRVWEICQIESLGLNSKIAAVNNLIHAYKCKDANCPSPSCMKMKRAVLHNRQCKRKANGNCPLCKQLMALCCYHAKVCQDINCPVHFCPKIKQKYKQLQSQRNLT